MDGHGDVGLIDTTRAELRERTRIATARFESLLRDADPKARPKGSDWSVQQTAAHVLTVAHRYRDLARTGAFNRGGTPAEVITLNQAELESVMKPLPVLAAELEALAPEIEQFFDSSAERDRIYEFHCGGMVDGFTLQSNWMAELLLHGSDIAQALGASWELAERDMLLVLRGGTQIGPAYLRPEASRGTDVTVAFSVPGARPYLIRIDDGTAEFRAVQRGDRLDAALRAPAVTLTKLFYKRIGPLAAVRQGLRVVGGRRPWLALKLMDHFDPA